MFAKAAMTDVPLVCFILGSIYFLLLSDKPPNNDRYAALSGVFFGLALMTKQFVALLIPAIIIIYWVTTKRSIRFLFTKRFALFLAVGVLIFAPWAIAMYISFGSEFTHWYLTYTGVMRTFSPLEGHIGSPLYYFIFLATKENLLWIALLPLATGLCIFNSVAKHSKTDTLILLWMAIVFVAFTVAQTKIYYYIMPAYPAFAIAISALFYETAKKFNLKRYLHLPKQV
jgi:4-amino-4-deoxy-L-arabinose transferase-like glycosyltransferase